MKSNDDNRMLKAQLLVMKARFLEDVSDLWDAQCAVFAQVAAVNDNKVRLTWTAGLDFNGSGRSETRLRFSPKGYKWSIDHEFDDPKQLKLDVKAGKGGQVTLTDALNSVDVGPVSG